ncbi:hypothetical protein VTI74DRAFT_9234 [Chaetomium olivicolor]
MCLNFEGTLACVPQGSSWCALNLDTFEGVGCWSGICCHGQCYAQNAVCCDNPGTRCTLGKACNVCNPGQLCRNGGCSGDPTDQPDNPPPETTTRPPNTPTTTREQPKPTPTTSTTTVANPSTLSITTKENPPTPPSSTSSSPKSTSTSTSKSTSTSTSTTAEVQPTTTEKPPVITPTPTTSTSTEPPKPTTVSAVGPFQSPTCIQDFVEARVLVNGSVSDFSENGITIEKCIELAQGWQYAGVEYGGECFWGDEAINPQSANQGDCSQPCSGDGREICGNGNRMLLYKDTTWKIPTRPDLGAQVQEYLELLAELQQLVQQWNDLIQQAIAQQGNARRQTDGTDILVQIANARAAILRLQARWKQLTATLSRHFKTGNHYRILEEIEMQDLADLYPHVDAQLAAIATDAAVVANSGLNVVATIAGKAITTLGKPRVIKGGIIVVAATGIFELGFHLLDSLLGSGGGTSEPPVSQPPSLPPTMAPTSTPEPTKTSTATKTSSTCTYTEGPTPVIVVTKQGTTTGQFQALVKSLPVDLNSEQLTDSWLPNWAYIGKMDRCTAESLWSNPIVEAMTLDRPIVLFEGTGDDPTAINPDAPITKRSETTIVYNNSARNSRREQREVTGRTLGSTSRYRTQTGSGVHLKWLAAQSNQRSNHGQFYDFEDYLYDDRSLKAPQVFPPRIYIVDTAFLATHDDFASRVKMRVFVSGYNGPGVDNNHGTCMTSIAAGSWTGVYKDADIGLIEAKFNTGDKAVAVSATIKAFRAIIKDVTDLGLQGNAVVSMSFGAPAHYFWWAPGDPDHEEIPPIPSPNTDAIGVYLHALFNMGVAAAASAGNYADKPSFAAYATLQAHTPRRNGGANSPLVVVGNADKDGKRYPSSNFRDEANEGILTVYMNGDDILCAVKDNTNAWAKEPAGTSQATAATAGLMAYFLSDPELRAQFVEGGVQNMPMRLKQHLVAVSTAQKGIGGWGDPDTDHIPRLATGENVECNSNVIQGSPPVPQYQSPPQTATGRQLATSEVTSGMTVVLPQSLRPACYNRP